jgi:hypothetical protein
MLSVSVMVRDHSWLNTIPSSNSSNQRPAISVSPQSHPA